jgi:pimeloyl-ACP methyl ester carboxylesterase
MRERYVRETLFTCAALAVMLGGCSSVTTVTQRRGSATVSRQAAVEQPRSTIVLPVVEGRFDVGGHKLYLRCEGGGSHTVVYMHGIIVTRGSSQNSGLIPSYLRDRARVCIYDRANVGLSDKVRGPLTGEDAVTDLHTLLATAHIRGPFILLGASFGGLIAVMYAATYPDDVNGMVLLDASLPDDVISIDERFLPSEARMQPNDWKRNVEQLDQLTTYRQAHAMRWRKVDIPVTYIATTRIDLDPSWPVEKMTTAIRAEQSAFVERFSAGRLLVMTDVPHFMEQAIPEIVADEVKRLIGRSK